MIREDLIKNKSDEEKSAKADPVWPAASGELSVNEDPTELAKNSKGELEEVMNEDAITAEVWKERVPGGESSNETSSNTEKREVSTVPKVKENTSKSSRAAVGTYIYNYEFDDRSTLSASLVLTSDGSASNEMHWSSPAKTINASGTWRESGDEVTITFDIGATDIWMFRVSGNTLARTFVDTSSTWLFIKQ